MTVDDGAQEAEWVDPSGVDWNDVGGREAKRKNRARRRNAGSGETGDAGAEVVSLRPVGEDERVKPENIMMLSGEYDPDKFYLPSADAKGHSTQIKSVNVPQNYARAMGILREHYPEYRSNSDIVRDGLVHILMNRLRAKDDGFVTAFMRLELDRASMEYIKLEMEMRASVVEMYKDTLEMASRQEDWSAMVRGLEKLESTLNSTEETDSETPYYRRLVELFTQYTAEMKRVRESGKWTDRTD